MIHFSSRTQLLPWLTQESVRQKSSHVNTGFCDCALELTREKET